MAFKNLNGIKIYANDTVNSYIFSDYFTVFEKNSDLPLVFKWSDIKTILEQKNLITVMTTDYTFKINKNSFASISEYLKAIAIIEGAVGENDIQYVHGNRILPTKDLYISSDVSDDSFIAYGTFDDNEMTATNIIIMNNRLVKFLWIIAFFVTVAVFATLHFAIGTTKDNFLFFIPIAVVSGGIIALITYMICYIAARSKFNKTSHDDISLDETITFVVNKVGFAAVEKSIYTFNDIIPWKLGDYFIETDKMYVIFKNKAPIFFLPKRLFDKKDINNLSSYFYTKLEQR